MDRKIQFQEDRQAVFKDLYQLSFPDVARLIKKMGGNYEDAKDTFHDAVILLYERVVQGQETFPEHPKAYLKTIARNLWLKKQQEAKFFQQVSDKETVPLSSSPPTELKVQVLQYLRSAGKRCMEILQAVYYHQWSMEEVADQFGYRNARSATVQKHKCLEKVRDQVKTNHSSPQALSYA